MKLRRMGVFLLLLVWLISGQTLAETGIPDLEKTVGELRVQSSRPDLAAALYQLGIKYFDAGRYVDSERVHREGLAIREGGLPLGEIADSAHQLARACWRQQKYAEGERLVKKGLELRQKLYGARSPQTGESLNLLGVILMDQDKYADAEARLLESLDVRQATKASSLETGQTLANLAILYSRQSRAADAIPYRQRAIAIQEKLNGAAAPQIGSLLVDIAKDYFALQKLDESIAALRRAASIREAAFGGESAETIEAIELLGIVYLKSQKFSDAEPLLERAVEAYRRLDGENSVVFASALLNLGDVHLGQGDSALALSEYQRSLPILEAAWGKEHPKLPPIHDKIADGQRSLGRYGDAEASARRGLAIREKRFGNDSAEAATGQYRLWGIYLAKGAQEQARTTLATAYEMWKRAGSVSESDAADALARFDANTVFPTAPILRLDLAMHSEKIVGMATDRKEQLLATVSSDKTVRVWRLPTLTPVNTLRLPDGATEWTSMNAVAFTPDGKTVIVGGVRGLSWGPQGVLYFVDVATGRIKEQLLLDPPVTALQLSPDGNLLAVGTGANQGGSLRVYRLPAKEPPLVDTAYKAGVTRIAWNSGRISTSSGDGQIRLYDIGGKGLSLLKRISGPNGREPAGLAFSPDGTKLAVAYFDNGNVDVLSAETLEVQFSPSHNDWSLNKAFTASERLNDLASVAWSANGDRLYAAGGQRSGYVLALNPFSFIRQWSEGGRGRPIDAMVAQDRIFSLLPLGNGEVIFATGDPTLGIVDQKGSVRKLGGGKLSFFEPTAFRHTIFNVSPDGRRVQASYRPDLPPGLSIENYKTRIFEFDLDKLALVAPTTEGILPPVRTSDSAKFELNRKAGKLIVGSHEFMAKDLKSGSYAFSHDGSHLVFWADGQLVFFDVRKDATVKSRFALEMVSDVNISRDGSVIVLQGDGTVRWFDLQGEEILALFVHNEVQKWLAWTPDGFFAASDDSAAAMVGWHVNRGSTDAPDFYPMERFWDTFYRPDVVIASLGGKGEVARPRIDVAEALRKPPPYIKFLSAQSEGRGATKVRYAIKNQGGGIGEVRVFHNGKLISTLERGPRPQKTAEVPLQLKQVGRAELTRNLNLAFASASQATVPASAIEKEEEVTGEIEVEGVSGTNDVSIVAFNGTNTVQTKPFSVAFESKNPKRPSRMFILAVGINRFKDPRANLGVASKDASDFASRLAAKAKSLFGEENVVYQIVSDGQATKRGILEAARNMAEGAHQGDVFVFFAASHGVIHDGYYSLITHDYAGSLRPDAQISAAEIVELSKTAKPLSQLFVLDTCHAGGVDSVVAGFYDSRVTSLARKMGFHVLASASSQEEALDDVKGNGLFTHAMLKALQEPATDANGDGFVSVLELASRSSILATTIAKELGHRQKPSVTNHGKDYPVFRLD